jgi:hypothetical protein
MSDVRYRLPPEPEPVNPVSEEEEQKRGLIRAYRMTFRSPSGLAAMTDLMKVCRFRVPLVSHDMPLETNHLLIAEGRRQVFLHIMQMCEMPEDELMAMYRGQASINPEND